MGNSDSQDSPQPRLGGSHHLPPYGMPTRPTSKWLFVPRLPNRSFEITKVGTPMTLGAHNFECRPLIEMMSKAKL